MCGRENKVRRYAENEGVKTWKYDVDVDGNIGT